MEFFVSLFIASLPATEFRLYSEILEGKAKTEVLLKAVSQRSQATAALLASIDALVAKSKTEDTLSKQIVSLAELEMAEADPVKLAKLKAERKLLHAEYKRVRGLAQKP